MERGKTFIRRLTPEEIETRMLATRRKIQSEWPPIRVARLTCNARVSTVFGNLEKSE